MNIPDSIEEVYGYRVWRIDEDKLIPSATRRHAWVPGTNEAICYADIEERAEVIHRNVNGELVSERINVHGLIPSPECSCGFWLLTSLTDAAERFGILPRKRAELWDLWHSFSVGPPLQYVIGRVKGWGRTVVAENGHRCEYAEIVELLDAKNPGLHGTEAVERMAEIYGVPLTRTPALDRKEEEPSDDKSENMVYSHTLRGSGPVTFSFENSLEQGQTTTITVPKANTDLVPTPKKFWPKRFWRHSA